jgi:hypothetical protein
MYADGLLSSKEASQLDDNVIPPSSCCITFLLVTTADLLLDQTVSVTVFIHFLGGSGGVGIKLAVREAIMA